MQYTGIDFFLLKRNTIIKIAKAIPITKYLEALY